MRLTLVGPASPRVLLAPTSHQDVPLGMGGVPVNDLALALIDHGYDVTVVTGSYEIDEPKRFCRGPLTVRVVPFRSRARDRALDLFKKERQFMAAEIKCSKPDVVHAHWTYEFALSAFAQEHPTLITIHDAPWGVLRRDPSPYRVLRYLMAILTRLRHRNFTAVSPYLQRAWRRQLIDPRPIRLIPNLVPELEAIQAVREKCTVIDIANASELKNVSSLIESCRILFPTFPALRLVLIGPGLGPNDRFSSKYSGPEWAFIEFVGEVSRSELPHFLGRASVLCHLSLEESQGLCLIEAMLADVPVLVSRQAAGAHWTISDGAAGIIVDALNPSDVAEALREVLESSELRRRLISAGEQTIRERFNRETTLRSYVDAYCEVLANER